MRRSILVLFVVAAFLSLGMVTACVVRSRPAHTHRPVHHHDHGHGKHKKAKKPKKHKKHR